MKIILSFNYFYHQINSQAALISTRFNSHSELSINLPFKSLQSVSLALELIMFEWWTGLYVFFFCWMFKYLFALMHCLPPNVHFYRLDVWLTIFLFVFWAPIYSIWFFFCCCCGSIPNHFYFICSLFVCWWDEMKNNILHLQLKQMTWKLFS